MKIRSNAQKIVFVGLSVFAFAFFTVSAAHAQLLLTINDSNSDAVVITATGTDPLTSVSPQLIADGIDLQAFFTGNVDPSNVYLASTTTLTTGDLSSGPLFNAGGSDQTGDEFDNVDLNLYHNDTDDTISFTSTLPAFTGTLTLSLSGTGLPTPGTTGAVLAGFSGSGTTPIGTYLVVSAPEPSTWMLLLGGVGAVAFLRRDARRI